MLEIRDYVPELSDACVALERECAQGERFRLSFRRPTFHARAATYERWMLLVARDEGRLVATAAIAVRPVTLHGEARTAAFCFDLRVHPSVRRRGVAAQMTQASIERAVREGASLLYSYAVGDNAAVMRITELFEGAACGGYRYLVWPVFRRLGGPRAREVSAMQAHEAFVRAEGPFDFYAPPAAIPAGHVTSLAIDGAGCSVWSNEAFLQEVVERVPRVYALARSVSRAWPFSTLRLPHVPAPGEALRSWFVYDVHAADVRTARALMACVNDEALSRGIDYCYVVGAGEPRWWPPLRDAATPLFSPVIPYTLLMRDLRGVLRRPQSFAVDARDL